MCRFRKTTLEAKYQAGGNPEVGTWLGSLYHETCRMVRISKVVDLTKAHAPMPCEPVVRSASERYGEGCHGVPGKPPVYSQSAEQGVPKDSDFSEIGEVTWSAHVCLQGGAVGGGGSAAEIGLDAKMGRDSGCSGGFPTVESTVRVRPAVKIADRITHKGIAAEKFNALRPLSDCRERQRDTKEHQQKS